MARSLSVRNFSHISSERDAMPSRSSGVPSPPAPCVVTAPPSPLRPAGGGLCGKASPWEGRPTVAALAGDSGIWLLDTRERSWTLLPAPAPLVQVTAVDDDAQHVLALSADGRVLVLDGTTGTVLAETAPLVAESLADATGVPLFIADQQRAYLNAPAERRLYEIDFADGARIAREFETPTAPAFVGGTGR